MFEIIDRITKETRTFYLLNNRTSNNLLKIIKENIITNKNQDINLDVEYLENDRIYSDSFTYYQPNIFLPPDFLWMVR